jgi:hypothetical protein
MKTPGDLRGRVIGKHGPRGTDQCRSRGKEYPSKDSPRQYEVFAARRPLLIIAHDNPNRLAGIAD